MIKGKVGFQPFTYLGEKSWHLFKVKQFIVLFNVSSKILVFDLRTR